MTEEPVWDREVPWRVYPGKNLQVQIQKGENKHKRQYFLPPLFFGILEKKFVFKIISDLKKGCKNKQHGVSESLYPASPYVNISYNQRHFSKLRINTGTSTEPTQIVPVFPLVYFFCSRIPHYLVVMSPQFSSVLYQFLKLSLSFTTLTILKNTGQLSCSMSFSFGLSDVSS